MKKIVVATLLVMFLLVFAPYTDARVRVRGYTRSNGTYVMPHYRTCLLYTSTKDLQPAKHLNKFLTYITGNFNVYWLTTHCKGDATATIQYLANHLDDDLIKLAKKIHPTNWSTLKTEAIDWNLSLIHI